MSKSEAATALTKERPRARIAFMGVEEPDDRPTMGYGLYSLGQFPASLPGAPGWVNRLSNLFSIQASNLRLVYKPDTVLTADTNAPTLRFSFNRVAGATPKTFEFEPDPTLTQGALITFRVHDYSIGQAAQVFQFLGSTGLEANFEILYIDATPSILTTDISNTVALLNQIKTLRNEDSYAADEAALKPETEEKAQQLIISLGSSIDRFDLPRADVYTYDGSIRIVWRNQDRVIKLIVPAQERPYLSRQQGAEYRKQENLDPGALVSWFEWLLGSHYRRSWRPLVR